MPLAEIVGQTVAVQCLERLVRKARLPHAMLFHGPSGCGKRATALALAQAVNCPEAAERGTACGACPVCQRIAKGIDVDVRIFEPTRNEFRREQAATLREEAFISPNALARKFLILDAAHRITPEAANLLLKVLEEPPDTTVFILLTDNPHLMLPTIKSRSMPMPFRPLSEEDAAVILKGRVPAGALPMLHAMTGGDMGRMISLASEPEMDRLTRDIQAFLDQSLLRDKRTLSPTAVAETLQEFAARIDLGGLDDTAASRARKGLVHVLESMNAVLGVKLRRRVRGEVSRPPAPSAIAALMKSVMDTIRIIEGSGHQVLALEGLAMSFQPDPDPAPKG